MSPLGALPRLRRHRHYNPSLRYTSEAQHTILLGQNLYDAIAASVADSDLWGRCIISLGKALAKADFLPALCDLGFPSATLLDKLGITSFSDGGQQHKKKRKTKQTVPSAMAKITKRMIPVLCSRKLRLCGVTPFEPHSITSVPMFQTEVQVDFLAAIGECSRRLAARVAAGLPFPPVQPPAAAASADQELRPSPTSSQATRWAFYSTCSDAAWRTFHRFLVRPSFRGGRAWHLLRQELRDPNQWGNRPRSMTWLSRVGMGDTAHPGEIQNARRQQALLFADWTREKDLPISRISLPPLHAPRILPRDVNDVTHRCSLCGCRAFRSCSGCRLAIGDDPCLLDKLDVAVVLYSGFFETDPTQYYCDQHCQNADWRFHREVCLCLHDTRPMHLSGRSSLAWIHARCRIVPADVQRTSWSRLISPAAAAAAAAASTAATTAATPVKESAARRPLDSSPGTPDCATALETAGWGSPSPTGEWGHSTPAPKPAAAQNTTPAATPAHPCERCGYCGCTCTAECRAAFLAYRADFLATHLQARTQQVGAQQGNTNDNTATTAAPDNQGVARDQAPFQVPHQHYWASTAAQVACSPWPT